MGLLPSLAMLFLEILLFCFCDLSLSVRAQSLAASSSTAMARALDTLLQDYAFRAFVHPRTGIPYDGHVPANLTGIEIAAMRLRSGSLRSKGVKYKEFQIGRGVIVQPYVLRLVLVYQNLGNWSEEYYPPLPGYSYLAPVLGLLAFNASNLSATHLPELDMRATGEPILINFTSVRSAPAGFAPQCVWINSQGVTNFSRVESGHLCSSLGQGHFSIVVEAVAPPPAPQGGVVTSGTGNKSKSRVWVIVGSVLGGVLFVMVFAIIIMWALKYRHQKNMQLMETAAEVGEPLQTTTVAGTKAPSATHTRTQPTLETEYAP